MQTTKPVIIPQELFSQDPEVPRVLVITSQNLRLLISSLDRSSVDLMLTAYSSNNIQEGNPLTQLCAKKSLIFHHQDPFVCGNHSSLGSHAHTSKNVHIYLFSFLICLVESVHTSSHDPVLAFHPYLETSAGGIPWRLRR